MFNILAQEKSMVLDYNWILFVILLKKQPLACDIFVYICARGE